MAKSDHPTKKLFPNPFYVILLLASTLFVVTTLGYLVAPADQYKAGAPARQAAKSGTAGVSEWLERHGPTALGVEFGLMLASGLLAMATDRWFPEKPTRPAARSD